MYSVKNLLYSPYELRVNKSQIWINKNLFLLRKEKKTKQNKRKKGYLRYSFEILEILWKERSKCTAGIKQRHQKNRIFLGDLSLSLITGEIHWENKNLMKVMTHLPWEVSFQKINVLQKRRKLILWSILWETRLMRWLKHFLLIWFFLMLLKKFVNLCDNRGIMSTHTFHSTFVINKFYDIEWFLIKFK